MQVADEVDHCWWGRPEDMHYTRKAYRVTCQNPGSQPGASWMGGGIRSVGRSIVCTGSGRFLQDEFIFPLPPQKKTNKQS